MGRFVIINGEIVEKEESNLSQLFWEDHIEIAQKCWFGFGGIPLLNENLDLLELQLEAVKIPLPIIFHNKRELFRLIKRMLNKNKFYRSGLVHFRIFSHTNKVTSVTWSEAFETFDFPLSENGILVHFSTYKKHTQNHLNPFLFFNQMFWNAATAQLKNTHFQNAVFLNEKGAVCDCIQANIFFIQNDKLITPALNTGCYDDVLRSIILELATKINLKVVESENIQPKDVLDMDEIFIAGGECGIKWVLGVENKRYVHHYSTVIHEKLNAFLKKKAAGQ